MRVLPPLPPIGQAGTGSQPRSGGSDFLALLRDAIGEVNQMQHEADLASVKLAHGEMDFHTAMITVEKANLALQLTMAIRTKVLDAYQEVMRMQV